VVRARSREALVGGEEENLDALAGGALRFGFGPRADIRGDDVELFALGSSFSVNGVGFTLPVPGRHNVADALAALAACRTLDVPLEDMVAPLSRFEGVGRRFQTVGVARGVAVIDDFAHNADKIAAALATAKLRAGRVLAVYQPHGYGPTRFLRGDFVATFARELRRDDRLFMLEVFYAGGTAARDFSAAEIVAEVAEKGADATFAPSRDWLVARLAEEARPGDLVLVMGARDPTLTGLAREIVAAIDRAGAGAAAG
jgi:UDP-N-acetylmuramate--alanine ligase